jgi:hypothetical protein
MDFSRKKQTPSMLCNVHTFSNDSSNMGESVVQVCGMNRPYGSVKGTYRTKKGGKAAQLFRNILEN